MARITNSIRLLSLDKNQKGDLFTRLAKDLFFALGYGNLRLDVHQSGRELDVQGQHRFESRRVIAECKAHKEKIGGADLNKFFGVLARERIKKDASPIAGYFVSLSGFTETAIEQEINSGEEALILLDGAQVIANLVNSRVIVGEDAVAEVTGACANNKKLKNFQIASIELVGHEKGYIWLVLLSVFKELKHYLMVHADGTPLAKSVAEDVLKAEPDFADSLRELTYIEPKGGDSDQAALGKIAVEKYKAWVGEDCGFIHLDGMPADSDLSVTRLKLEKLFIPLKGVAIKYADENKRETSGKEESQKSIGAILDEYKHIALLAMPGAGKSTLIKRLATAYSFPERHDLVTDSLPKRDWLPLILRCRDLRDRAYRPISELLEDIPRHSGMSSEELSAFNELSQVLLRDGKVLLLIDGLDEIAEEGPRSVFANNLRTFLAVFPHIGLIVTSREAGFRLVAGVIAGVCQQVKLAPLDSDDVLNLCVRWHLEVGKPTPQLESEATLLAHKIWESRHLRTLVENPLLLTTLLVVKRWVRELPRSRAALYREAIKVLVRTWNVEGYEPLDEEEALAQLSYVACSMTENGIQLIGHKSLLNLLRDARTELDAELQFSKISPQDFIKRIEHRSSLLMQAGYMDSDGLVEPVYEFRHLTFQEYLTARGYVEEQYPGRAESKTIVDLMRPHFLDQSWREVIPLSAVLSGRKSEELIKTLISEYQLAEKISDAEDNLDSNLDKVGILLHACIKEEVQVTTPTLREALGILADGNHYHGHSRSDICSGKFGSLYKTVTEEKYEQQSENMAGYLGTLSAFAMIKYTGDEDGDFSKENISAALGDLRGCNKLDRIYAALFCMNAAYSTRPKTEKISSVRNVGSRREDINGIHEIFQLFFPELLKLIDSEDAPSSLAAAWALAWLSRHSDGKLDLSLNIFKAWLGFPKNISTHFLAWAFLEQELMPRDHYPGASWGECDDFLLAKVEDNDGMSKFARFAALTVGWYRKSPWNDAELVEKLFDVIDLAYDDFFSTGEVLLNSLGDLGLAAEKKLKDREAERKAKDNVDSGGDVTF